MGRVNVRRLISGPRAVRTWRWLLAGLVLVVSGLSLTPVPIEPLHLGWWDKLNHACAFAALTLAAAFALPRWRDQPALIFGALLAFGALIEVAQSFTATRSAEWGDLLADVMGMAAGGLAAMLVTRRGTAQLR